MVSGRLQDLYSNDNGGIYTLDAEWQFNIGSGWSPLYDDVLLIPGGDSIVLEAGDGIYMHVRPFYVGASGSYLLDMKVTRYLQTTATHDLLPEGAIVVGPNPAKDMLIISFVQDDVNPLQLDLYSITGQLIYSAVAEGGRNQSIDLRNEPDGVYVVKVSTEKGIWVRKVIIGH